MHLPPSRPCLTAEQLPMSFTICTAWTGVTKADADGPRVTVPSNLIALMPVSPLSTARRGSWWRGWCSWGRGGRRASCCPIMRSSKHVSVYSSYCMMMFRSAAGQLVAGMVQLRQGREEGKLLLTRALKVAHNAMTNHQLVAQVCAQIRQGLHRSPLVVLE